MAFDRVVSVILTTAAVVMAVAVAKREFATPGRGDHRNLPEFEPDWEQWIDGGIFTGERGAPVKILEFVDFQCPGCKAFHESVLRPLRARFGSAIAHVVIHLPLSNHRYAISSAVAAECADEQGRFEAFVDLAFAKQDSLGTKPWGSFAEEAGVPDQVRFGECLTSSAAAERVDRGRLLADSLGIEATPTVLVNGWRFPVPPSMSDLSRVIQELELEDSMDPFR